MTLAKHQSTIDTSIAQPDLDRVLTSSHLQDSTTMIQCVEATNAFWYPIALSDELIHPDAKIELIFLVSERKLSVYIED